MPLLLEIRGLTRRFGGLTAVNAVDLQVGEGELLSVIGPNGAGKTTLFNLVTGLDRPDAGQVLFDGQDITGLPAQQLAQRGLARTFQHGRVFANLSVLDNDLLTLRPREAAPAHLQALRAQGLSERNIVSLSQLIAYVNFQVRLLAGLQLLQAHPVAEGAPASNDGAIKP